MAKRKTHEEFIEEMKIVNPNIEILGKYKNLNASAGLSFDNFFHKSV